MDAGGAAGGLSPAELLTQLVDLRGQVRTAERERDRDRLATSQLMAEVEAKAVLMQEQQVCRWHFSCNASYLVSKMQT